MTAPVMKIEALLETCSVCGSDGSGELLTPEEHDAGTPQLQVPLRAMLLHLNNNKVVPEGRLCLNCVRRTTDAYEFSIALSARGVPPLSEKIRALRRRLHELTQKIDVFIVVGGPGMNAGGTYSEEDIIMVEKDALAAAAAADDEDLERAKNARGDSVYQCSVCPLSFQRVAEYRAHTASHPADALHSCWTCGAQFASRDALREHAAEHALDHVLVCYLCNGHFQSASELRRHSSSCAGDGTCPACGAACVTRAALAAHAVAEHGPAAAGAFVCAACFRTFSARDEYAAHALTHRQADHYVCGYDGCILRFGTRSNLLSHIRKCHAGASSPSAAAPPATPVCPHCGRTFGSVAAMKRHARVHRTQREEGNESQPEGAQEAEPADGHVEYLEEEALEDVDYGQHAPL